MVDNTSNTNITLTTPKDDVIQLVEITPETQLTFDFNPKLVEYELTEDGDLLLTFKNGGGYTFKGFAEIEGDINVSVDGYVVSMSGLLLDLADIDTASGESKSLTSGQQGFEEGFGDTLGGIDNLTLQGETLTNASGDASSDIPDLTVDVTPPDIDQIDLTTPSDSGTFNDDNLTNVANPIFAGSAEAFSTVTLFADGVLLGATKTDANGNWEFQSPTLSDGVYDITATATDANGNTSAPTPPLSVEIDLTTPATPDITFTDNQDGISTYINAEEVTGDGTPTTTVNVLVPNSARTGDTLVITYKDINGTEQAVSTVLTSAQVHEGVNIEVAAIGEFELNVTAKAFDPAGNEGDTTTSSVLIDTILPDAPGIDLQVDSRVEGDNYTNNGLLTFTGEANSVLQFTVVDDMGNSIATPSQTSMVNGTFTFDMDSLPDGTYTVVATLTDTAGNTSAPQQFSYTLDQTNPDLVTINESLPEISEDVPFNPSLGLFVEQLQASEPNVTYEIVGGNDNNWFTLTPDGELSVTEAGINAGVMNFEQPDLGDGRTINIQTTDQAGNTNINDYTLKVTNVNERPDAVDFSYTDTIETNAGLQGSFYAFDNQTDLPPGINWTKKNAFDYVEAHISNSDTPTDATFIAEQLDFGVRSGTLDTFSELSNFIGESGSDLVDTRPDDNFDSYADRGIIKLDGSAFFEEGEHRIRVYSDDGFQLKIDGEVVASFYNDRAPGTTTVNIGDLTEGFHDIEIIYWGQGGRYELKVEDSVRPEGEAWSNFEVLGSAPSTLVHNPLVTDEDNSLNIDVDLLVNQASDPDQNTTLSLVEDSLELQATVNGIAVTGVEIIPPVTDNGVTYTNEISGVGQIGTDTNGNIVFTPAENYNGEVSFTYEIQDDGTPQLVSDPATVTLNITPVNDTPTAGDTASYDDGIEDQALVITRADLLEDLDIQDVEDGQNVILDIASTNSDILSITYNQTTEEFTIIPKENFNGDTQLRLSIEDQDGATTYRAINANFDPVNDVPTADLTTNFDTGVEDQTLYITRADIISSLNIDDVEDGQNVILDLTTSNSNIQSVSYDAVNEQYVIEPVENFNGDVQFNLSITDQEGASIQRTIGANFDPVNDVPTADLTTNFDTGVEDQTLYITRADIISSLNIDDVEDGQNVILDLTTSNPNIQSVSYDAVNEQYVIEPVENFNGDVQFNLSITDQEGASIQRTIGANFDPVNDVPTADLTTNFDTGVEDQTLYITRVDIISSLNIADVEDGQNVILDLTTSNPNIQSVSYDAVNEQYVIEPVENFNGDVQFNLSITDQEGASIQRTIGANFDPVNDVPTADLTTNFDTGVEDQTLYITRVDIISSLNIADVEDGQNVILDLTTSNPNIQSVSYDAVNEQYVIEPVENFNGDVQFNLSITDQEGASIQRTIGANFDPVNDVPTADLTTNFDTGVEDQTLYITRADIISSLNIADVEDGQNVILDLTTSNPNIQSVSYDAVNEQYVIEPVENFNGDVQFNLSITDQEGASIQRTIGVNFDPVNDVPTADLTTNFDTGVEDQTLYITRADIISSLNIADVEDGQNIILDLTTSNPNIQSVSYDAVNEQYVIEPVENFNGDVQFNLSITDQEGASIQRTIGANFDPVNDVPTADLTTIFDTGVEDQTLYITRADIISSLNIADVEDEQNVILDLTTSNPNIQSVSYDAVNEQYVIEPVENFNGDVQFNLSITDQEGASIQRTIGANFDPVNDVPTADDALIGTIEEDAIVPVTFTTASIISDMNIIDVDGDNLTLTYTPNPVQLGVVTYEGTGGLTFVLQSGDEIEAGTTYSFTPAANVDTDFVFDVTATDPSGASTIKTATIDVLPVNDAPTLVFETPTNTNPNIIINGSFEDTDGVSIPDGGLKGFDVIPGWNKTQFDAEGNPIDPRDQMEVHDEAHSGLGSADGDNFMDLGASPDNSGRIGNVGMTQVIDDAIINEGETYELTFFVKNKAAAFNSNNADSGDLKVVWNGIEVPIDLPDGAGPDWVEVNVTVTAGAGNNVLTFYETGEGGDNHGMAVDNISLVEVATITTPIVIPEDLPTDTIIAHAVASDIDSEHLTFSFSDGSLEQNGFIIDPSSGEIKVTAGGPFNDAGEPFDIDAPTTSDTITLDVKVDDNDGASTTQQLVISLTDINDNPVTFAPAQDEGGASVANYAFTVTETDTAVGAVTATDIDRTAGDITYSLENTDGSPVNGFAIDQSGNIVITDPAIVDVDANNANAQQTYVVRAESEDGSVNTQQITISVQDINDNPVIFNPAQNNDGSVAPNYMFTMDETEGVVGTITAQDADQTAGDITYSLENLDGSTLNGFAIDQNGNITVTDPSAIELDPNGLNEFQSFVVRAQSEDGSETTQPVQLTVQPVNEHALDFTDSTIRPVVIEETVNPEDGSRVVTQVEAKDFDYTENVTYELLNHTDKFEIDSQTGEITVKQGVILDNASSGGLEALGSAYESNGVYTLTEASMQENGAIWSNQTLDLTKDFTITSELYFGASPGGEGITFVLHPGVVDPSTTSGGSDLGANIDNAIVVEFDTNKDSSQDDPGFDHIAIHTDGNVTHESRPVQLPNIEDRDWHEATFSWDATNEIFTVTFEGRTATLSGDITQHLANNTEVNFGFTGSTASRGNLQQVNIISIDGIDQSYDLEVQATSADANATTPDEVITTTIPITITSSPNVNVNDVQFDTPTNSDGTAAENFNFTVTETNTVVGTINATDADYRSGDITFSLENSDGSPVSGFEIDQDGVITVTNPDVLDIDPGGENIFQNFVVRAQADDGSESTQEVSINVQDVNDNAVIFAQAENNEGTPLSNYVFNITEADSVVGTVTAADNDYTAGDITYSLTYRDGSPVEGYAIDENGVITITDPSIVDVDPDGINARQQLIVKAESEDGSISGRPVTIAVQDVNDNAVIFDPAESGDGSQLPDYAFTITESDSVVGTVAATDNDLSAGNITYSLENTDGSPVVGYAIDQSGNITITDQSVVDIDPDGVNTLQNIVVRAESEDGSVSTQPISITVQDINDNALIFDPAQNNDGSSAQNYIFTMTETAGVVGSITAQDADYTAGDITYSLENTDGTPLEGFAIDQNGTITVTDPNAIDLDPSGLNELQSFVVRAQSEDGSENTQAVQLTVAPVNEHVVDFTDSTIQPVVIEETVNPEDGSRVVTQVEATDFDYTENVTYELLNHTDKFEIDSQTGEITVKEGVILDNEGGVATFGALGTAYESNGIYTLTDATQSQDGAIWSDQTLDLTQDFSITADLFLGSSNGADGITFVLHPDGFTPADTTHGGSLGANIDNAVVVEFDTYRNSDLGDPWQDHVSIHTDGDLRHGSDHSQSIQTSDLEDGLWHEATFAWDATAEVFTVTFEGQTATLTGGLSQHLANSTNVHFGFTGTTGGLYNLQQVNIKSVEGLDITYALDVQATSADADPTTPSEVITTTVPITITSSPDVNINDVVFETATNSDGSNVEDFTFTITEASEVVGTITASDADFRSGEITYSLENRDGSPVNGFAIDQSGTITITDPAAVDIDPSGINALQNLVVRAKADDGSEAIQDITISVQDVNDNPVIFAPAENSDGSAAANYIFTISEDDSNVGTITATDNDFTAGDITYSLEDANGNPVEGFAIDQNGNITITDQTVVDMDPDGANALQNMVVRATAEDGSVNTQQITIAVQDVDDNPVIFAPAENSDGSPAANYTFTISEDDSNVGTITATDNDFTAGDITYSLEDANGNPVEGFAIDQSGNITITDQTVVDIDPDGTNALQNMVVRATAEDGSVNTQQITISVQDVDDNPVIFAPAENSDGSAAANYIFNISEDDSNVGTITATDNDFTAGDITYSLEDANGNPVEGFAIDQNGNITITDQTVVDMDPDGANALQNMVVRATAEDGSVNTQQITISVQDVDDNPVIFAPAENSDGSPAANYIFTISEDDSNVGTITATDKDFTAGDITYSLEDADGNPMEGFAIDQSGNITITDQTVVDMDPDGTNALQNMVVRATAEEGSVNTQQITITVQDVDDNPVIFAPAENSDGSPAADYTFTISEDDSSVGTITATDNDFTAGDITYSLEDADGNPVEGFAIDQSGNVTITDQTVVDMDPDGANALQNMIVRATAEDGSVNTQQITISVQDVDDNPVIFAPAENSDGSPAANYTFTISEDDSNVGTITATDNDFTAGDISYSLEDDNGNPVEGFAIDQNGKITTTDQTVVDMDPDGTNALQNMVVRATAEDGSVNTQQITISVQDVDDNPVIFAPAENSDGSPVADYTFTISEDDSSVGKITATDNDFTAGDITYSLEDADGNPVEGFAIDQSGNITITDQTIVDMDPDGANALQNMVVRATAEDGSVNTQQITIAVQDVDDNPVTFTPAENNDGSPAADYTFTISEDNSNVGTITATDNDFTVGDITYSLEDANGNPVEGFAIDQNGNITITDQTVVDMDPDGANALQNMIVRATAEDGSVNMQQITISVQDVNDNVITFDPAQNNDGSAATNFMFTMYETDGTVGTITAQDADFTAGSITYSIEDANGNPVQGFAIDQNGVITVTDSTVIDVDADDANASQNFVVRAQSEDGSESTQQIAISVLNVNDDIGDLSDTDTSSNIVNESVPIGTYVGVTLNAVDVDGDAITYSLPDDVPFTVGDDGRILTSSEIEFGDTRDFTFEATATSADGSSSTQTITINAGNLNPEAVGESWETYDTQDTSVTGILGANSAVDVYEFQHNGGRLTLDALTEKGADYNNSNQDDVYQDLDGSGTQQELDIWLEIWDDDGNRVAYNDDGGSRGREDGSLHAYDSYLDINNLAPGDYEIRVSSYHAQTSGPYKITIQGNVEMGNNPYTTFEDTQLVIDNTLLLGNDSDPNNDSISIVEVNATEDTHGEVFLDAEGNVVFTPELNFNGEASFTYTISDSRGGEDTATVTVFVESINDVPQISVVETTLTEDTAQIIATASDVDGEIVSNSLSATHGTVSLDADGNILYTPDADYNGSDNISISVTDDSGGTSTQAINVNVTGVNDVVVVGDIDLGSVAEDGTITFTDEDLIASSSDVDGDNLIVTEVSLATNIGTFTDNGNGTYTFTPTENFNGEDVPFNFTVSDGLTEGSATATLDVTAVNDAPVVGNIDLGTTPEDTTITFTAADLLALSTDVEGNDLSVTNVSVSADLGTLTNNGGDNYTFTPAANFNGEDVPFSFTVSDGTTTVSATATLDVTTVNDAAVVGNIDLGATAEDTAITFTATDLLASSSDVDGDNLSVTDVSVSADVGTLTNVGDIYTFTPAENFNGEDVPFNFTVSDGTITTSATATLDVTAVNDAPVVEDIDLGATTEDTAITFTATDLLASSSDVDGDNLNVTSVSVSADMGTLTNVGGIYTFTPAENFNGEDVPFNFTVSDGTITTSATATLDVTAVNDAPVVEDIDLGATTEDTAITFTATDLLASSSDVDGDNLNVTNVSVSADVGTLTDVGDAYTFTPAENFNGEDVPFNFTVSDGTTTTSATATLDVTAVNDAAVVGDIDLGATLEDTAVTFTAADLLASSSDVDGDNLSVTNVSVSADVGTLANVGGIYTFTPTENFNGQDVPFSFTVSDGTTTTSATATLDVTAVNDAAVIGDIDLGATLEDTAVTFTAADLLASSSDVDGDNLSVTNVSVSADVGTLANVGGIYTFTPAENFNGEDVPFSFTVSDGTTTTSATATLDVTAVNDAPVVENIDLGATDEDTATTFTAADLLAFSSDVDGDNLSVTNVSVSADVGTLTNVGGIYTFIPTENFNGEDVPFNFTVSDGTTTTSATATLDVTAVNDAAVVGDINLGATDEDTAITFTAADLLASSSDVDGDNLSVTNVSVSADVGTLTNVGDTYTFTPAENFNGEDVPFNFTVSDGTTTTSATATLDVTAVNDAAVVGDIDLGTTAEDTAVTFTAADLLAFSSDVDGDNLNVTNVSVSADVGTLTNVGGIYTFTPAENFNGEDVPFNFTVSDGTTTTSATATLDVTAVNDAAVVGDIDLGATDEDTAITFTAADLLASSSDVDGDNLNVTNISVSADVGTLTNVGDIYTFTPAENFNGEDVPFSFTVSDGTTTTSATVTLDVTTVNDAPVVENIDLGATDEDTAITFTANDLLASSSDVDGDNLNVTNVSVSADVGTLTNVGGIYTFTPAENFNGEDVLFNFTVSDGTTTTSATATLDVTAINDAPVTTNVDLGTIDEDSTIVITETQLLANATDVDGDTLSVTNLTSANGSIIDNGNGTWNLTPTENFSGSINVNYDISDGTTLISSSGILAITAVADAPSLFIQVANTDAVSNDTADFSEASSGINFDLTNHDAQTVNGEVDRWETNEVTGSDFSDIFSFNNLEAGETYTVHGGIGNNTIDLSSFVGSNVSINNDSGTLTVTIDDEGNTATINYDNISTIKFNSNVFDGTPHSVELDDHNWQVNGTEIEVTSEGADDWAVSPISFAGTLDESFTLNIVVTAHDDSPWHNGAIVFDYQDANNYKMAVARIGANRWQIEQVENGEHSNVAKTDYIQLDTNVPNEISLNIDGGVATIFSNGVEQISHDFDTPLNNGQIGVATNNSHTSFELNMEPSNWAPSVEDYDVRIQVQDGGFTTQNVLANAYDPEVASLEVTGFSQAGHGVVTDNGDGTFSYVPTEGFVGVDTFTYEISDGDNTTIGTVSIDVQSDAAISITSGESFILDVGASLADLDGSESLSVMLEGLPEGSVITDGIITLTVGESRVADVSDMSTHELLLTSPESYNASFDVTVRAISTEDTGGSVETSSEFNVNILNADLPTTGSVEIQGTAKVGGLLTADITNLIDLDGDIITEYQWYRGEGDNKEAIDGATGSDYTLTAADANHQITVEVTAGDLDVFATMFTDSTTYVAANPEFQGFTQSRELLLNGDFEDGAAHWTNDFRAIEVHHTGSGLWGDSNDGASSDQFVELSPTNSKKNNLRQTVTIDENSDTVTLKFDYRSGDDDRGKQEFSVYLGAILIAEDIASQSTWQTFEITLPVSQLTLEASREISLEFTEDKNKGPGLMLDDISLSESIQVPTSSIHVDNDIAQDGVIATLADYDEASTYILTNKDGSVSEDFSVNDNGEVTPLVAGASLPSGLTELKLTIEDGEGNSSEANIFVTKDTIDDIIYSSSDNMDVGPIILDGNSINDITGENDATDRFHIEGNEDVLIINFDATQGDTIDISSVLGGAEERIDLSASNIEEYVDISGDSGNYTITVKSEAPEAPEQVITIQDASGLDDQAALIQMLLQNN